MRVAAIQLEVSLADIAANLREAERLVRAAAGDGAELIALPEFFTTGAAFLPELANCALPADGAATQMLEGLARELGVRIGGSLLCRDDDGEVRNAYFLAGPAGLIGRHDKDLPTMWENAFYVGGSDDGVIEDGDTTLGAAVCWEFMRGATARRLRGRVDIVIGGSNWWSIPPWRPRRYTTRAELHNSANALRAPATFGRLVGAPVVHGAICGDFSCRLPELPALNYRGHFEGGALIADATGKLLNIRSRDAGPSYAIADVEARRSEPLDRVPDRFWLHRRGAIPTLAWHSQRLHGRHWYRRHVRATYGAR